MAHRRKQFKVGDRVQIIRSESDSGFSAKYGMIGAIGTVKIEDDGDSRVGIQFDNPQRNGHSLDGTAPSGYGWYVLPSEIVLLSKATDIVDPYKEFVDSAFKAESTSGTSAQLLPTDPKERKRVPIGTGVLDYFPAALAEVAKVSQAGNDQHNPGQPLHWARSKSTDQADTIVRHYLERGGLDTDGQRHSAKLAWRALALLQLELEEAGAPIARGAKI